MGKNLTGMKSLDKLASDPRVESVWAEGADGYWAALAPGYNVDGCGGLHGRTAREMLKQRALIREGETY